jgi:hypothetical protein
MPPKEGIHIKFIYIYIYIKVKGLKKKKKFERKPFDMLQGFRKKKKV